MMVPLQRGMRKILPFSRKAGSKGPSDIAQEEVHRRCSAIVRDRPQRFDDRVRGSKTNMAEIKSYKDLDVWKLSIEQCVLLYE